MEAIGVGYHNRCDASHPSLALHRGEAGIGPNVKSVGSIARKGFGQDGCRSYLTKGWRGPPEGELVPKLQQNKARLRARIE